jgi:MFS family permease
MNNWPDGKDKMYPPINPETGYSKSWLPGNKGLSLAGTERYSIMTLVFFPTYIIFQIPSTVIVRKLGPRLHLSTITCMWGTVMIVMAFISDWKAMAGLRVILGVLEAGFFPSCVYLLSTWYPRCRTLRITRLMIVHLLTSLQMKWVKDTHSFISSAV